MAEVECKQQTRLIKIWFDEETRIQKQLVADNRTVLDNARADQDRTLREAAGVNRAAGR
ncbi:MAG TPA: hypothetical protein VFY14_07160 [Streptomyces sp.]|nr:hypothetical protein [Streptomyces sp.]